MRYYVPVIAAAAFLGSFLAFTLELMAGKALLPLAGGGGSVWAACLMFYQGSLFAAFAACWLLPPGWARIHPVLLAAPALVFPVALFAAPPEGVWGVLLALTLVVGPPFFALSLTTPLLESLPEAAGARVYAFSNAGALLALALYPFVVEPLMGLHAQRNAWHVLYIAYVCVMLWLQPPGREKNEKSAKTDTNTLAESVACAALAAGPCAGLAAATRWLSDYFPSGPIVWAPPLALYLLSLIFAFAENPPKRSYMRLWPFALICLAPLALVQIFPNREEPWNLGSWVFLGGLAAGLLAQYVASLACHRALAERRPRAEALPRYYALMALGGWAGGAAAAIGLPVLARSWPSVGVDAGLAIFLCGAALAWRGREQAKPALPIFAACIALPFAMNYMYESGWEKSTLQRRNFHGAFRLVPDGEFLALIHGNTLHGYQSMVPERAPIPMAYYHPSGPLGELMSLLGKKQPRKVAAVGLGAGAVAAYGREGWRVDFFELDPDIEKVARENFTHLVHTRANVTVTIGDGRLLLERRPGTRYDLIVLDAFSSHAVPPHLLTLEAADVYRRRLEPKGIVAYHISSLGIELEPLLAALAKSSGLHGAAREKPSGGKTGVYSSRWVAMSADKDALAPLYRMGWVPLTRFRDPRIKTWTDGWSSPLPLYRAAFTD